MNSYRFRLQSTPLVYAPGAIAFAQRLHAEGNLTQAREIINAWPGLPSGIVEAIAAAHDITTEIDAEEAPIVTVSGSDDARGRRARNPQRTQGAPVSARNGSTDRRAGQIKAIHAMKRELGLADDSYRALVTRVTEGRVDSSKEMTAPERRKLLDALRRLGAGRKPRVVPRPDGQPSRPVTPAKDNQQRMIRGLWLELAGHGIIQDASEAALAAFVRRQAKVDALQFLTQSSAQSVIGALKAWRDRGIKDRRT